ncbi:L-serine ammonia-lyase [Sphingomonas canadensis]|uniref:L-serine dehydratase n=1 Tax=Sphingomonas canadensis TaxID=1219257 RepID=A0ABW3HB63_9SPHN|nr:L-serine ammonia-lyase [Sphingomonas canadensis]MCW3836927.1 L-serine ammonia-lyase [Sphingomonas canadensis]
MPASLFELFKIGVGPSSSHTMGPMTAACRFVEALARRDEMARVARVEVRLHGSLALTGRGHATDTAAIAGLHGLSPEAADPDASAALIARTRADGVLMLGGGHPIAFDEARDIRWHGDEILPFHPNAIRFAAFDAAGQELFACYYYSIGGGFVVDEDQARANARPAEGPAEPYPYASAAELLGYAERDGLTIAQVALANEDARRPRAETEAGIARILAAMDACIERGLAAGGTLPGGLGVQRRAARLREELHARMERNLADPLAALDLVNLWSIAVNEENAAGGKVVTAPTNGAAGVIPAVLRFIERVHGLGPQARADFLLTAAAIGALYKRNASISAAEVGCQGEVGVACSMAAAGLAAVLGGSNAQIENAAEIGMEHNLGLTCDPVGGLVQIPCIERNAIGAVKAIGAARLALGGDGTHHVTLDQVIETMRRTGHDMAAQYKETSLGGLAVCVPAC